MGPTGAAKVVQIHPTRKCNLRCLHCYSSSSPKERDLLEVALLSRAVTDAAKEGYNVVSISGGVPLVYRPLRELLNHARGLGLFTALVTNAILLDERRLDQIREVVDLLVISIDGKPASHNRIRGSNLAFEKMRSRLDPVRRAGLNFGFIFTLTQHNLDELEWVAKFALDEGAKLLQIHPLEEVGNAAEQLRGKRPDEIESAYAWLLAKQIQELVGEELAIRVDVVYSEALKNDPSMVYGIPEPADIHQRLADLVSPLVIETDGTVVPLHYGFPRAYAIGSLKEAPLERLAMRWREQSLGDFHTLCRDTYLEAIAAPKPYFFNWYELVSKNARSASSGETICA